MIHALSAEIPEEVEKLQADQIPWNNPHWHPAHGGIFRNVRLHVTDPLHVSLPLYSFLGTAGPYAYATEIAEGSAGVGVEVPVQNSRARAEEVELVVEVRDAGGAPVLTLRDRRRVAAGASTTFTVSGLLRPAQSWSPDRPYLYRVVSSLRVAGAPVDGVEVPLGIRTARWDAQAGLFLNGRPLKLRGWGQKPTDEWPGLGAAQPDWLHAYTLRLMREAGANFVRWGHCAGGPASIAAGDRLGLIADQPGVDGEADTHGAAWKVRAAAFRDVVVYYRNNPSILIWEGGNQKVSREHARELRAYVDTYDPHGGRAYAHRRADQVTAEFMTVGIGTEGGREIKELAVVEGEYDREEAPRRVWDEASPPRFGYPEGRGQTYQLTSEQFAVNQVAHFVKKLGAPDHAGGANWIFSDSTSGGRVATEVARASGEVDGVRLPKEAYFVTRVLFRDDPQVHLVGHWTYPRGTKKTVYAVSNAEEVELAVNGRAVGRAKPTDRFLFTFPDVAFEPGQITATAFTASRVVATDVRPTAGRPVALRLTPVAGPRGLQADGADVLLVDVEAVDAEGRRVPTLEQRVDFELQGPAVWRGGYNSGRVGSINHPNLDLEAGINRVAVRSTLRPGEVTLRATSHGLRPATLTARAGSIRVQNGYTTEAPPLLPAAQRFTAESAESAENGLQVSSAASAASAVSSVGGQPPARVVRSFSYSGPTSGVAATGDAREGRRVYTDRDITFAALPAELLGADYVQAADADRFYSAVDLMEIAVPAGATVLIAHDDRLPRPDWLTRQFEATSSRLAVSEASLTLWRRRAAAAESLTLGANTDPAPPAASAGRMYVVFVTKG
jgi:beta-galactosidase